MAIGVVAADCLRRGPGSGRYQRSARVGATAFDNGQVDEGRAFVYRGYAGGLLNVASWSVGGTQPNESLGSSVAGAGDVNGDGYGDIVVGSPVFSGGQT